MIKRSLVFTLCSLTIAVALPAPVRAELKPNGLFSDNTVLQQGMKVPVWGTTDKPDKVTVSFAGQEVSAAPQGSKWRVELAPLKPGDPQTLTISQGDTKPEIKNVLVGEVWICSGQSNMEWALQNTAGGKEAAQASKNDKIRLFTVPRRGAGAPEADVKGNWQLCDAPSVAGFTAVGYYFGRDLEKSLHVPIGLISSNVGGTTAERWMSQESLESYDDLKGMSKPQGANDLWNAMIAPLVPYAIRGAIWYQGESNADRSWQYRKLLPAMIKCWRDAFGEGDFPFLIVQLAPFQAITKDPTESAWAELRDAQLFASQSMNNVGLAVITDVGDERDIHPQRKKEVGERLALAARAMTYGEKIEYSGPIFEKLSASGDKLTLTFKHVGTGLMAKDGDLQGFTVAGDDKKFYNASAKIEGDTVVVWSDKVANPKAVRYGWANYPLGNLWNKENLPASPFRSDDFMVSTQNNK